MRCPLCGGPVHEEGATHACEVGHRFDDAELRRQANARLSNALWMAIEALDNEAVTLRLLGHDDQAARWADEAEEQAATLRGFAGRHAPRPEEG